jgi:hypothetical protein
MAEAVENPNAGALKSYIEKFGPVGRTSSVGTNRLYHAQLGYRPEPPHATYNAYEGTSIDLTPEQQEQNAHAERAASDWDTQRQAIQKAKEEGAAPKSSSAGAKKGSGKPLDQTVQDELNRVKAEIESQATPVVAAGRGTGQPTTGDRTLVESMPGKSFGQHLFGLHRQLDTIRQSLEVSKDPILNAYGDLADRSLNGFENEDDTWNNGAINHIRDGDRKLKTITGQTEGKTAYLKAAQHIKDAHEILSHPYIQEALKRQNINSELPSLSKMMEGAATYGVKLQHNPFPEISLGGKIYDINSPEALKFDKAASKEPSGSRAKAKSRLARRGTPRPSKLAAKSEQEIEDQRNWRDQPPKPKPASQGELPRNDQPAIAEVGTGNVNANARRGGKVRGDTAGKGNTPDNATRRERSIELVTGKAKRTRTVEFFGGATIHNPSIMGKPEIGPDVPQANFSKDDDLYEADKAAKASRVDPSRTQEKPNYIPPTAEGPKGGKK